MGQWGGEERTDEETELRIFGENVKGEYRTRGIRSEQVDDGKIY